jgi:hypothetical protein
MNLWFVSLVELPLKLKLCQETVCSGQSLRPGSFDVIIAIVYRSCRFDVGERIPIVISTLRQSSILSVYPSLVPASEMIEFTVVGQWDLSPSNCV